MTLVLVLSVVTGVFQEDPVLWERIDDLRLALNSSSFTVEELQEHFTEAMEIAFSRELTDQFEEIRAVAYETGDFTVLDEYIDRAGPAVQVISMGESIPTGVNILYFLNRSQPGTQAYEFFDLASDGFYWNGRIGTALLPVWMERSGSSAQATMNDDMAAAYAEIWQELSEGFSGVFLEVAEETISELGGSGPDLSEEELQSYYMVYQDPFVIHVRTALTCFLAGYSAGISPAGEVLDELVKYTSYLSDDFIVLTISTAPMGGKTMLLLSCSKPDRIFSAWVYEGSSGDMELRQFTESADFTRDEVGEIADRYRAFLQDREHVL